MKYIVGDVGHLGLTTAILFHEGIEHLAFKERFGHIHSAGFCKLHFDANGQAVRYRTAQEIYRAVYMPDYRYDDMPPQLLEQAGNPADKKSDSIFSAHCGTFGACFNKIPLPANKAGTAHRNTCQNGKFQGMIRKIKPKGSYEMYDSDASVVTDCCFKNNSAFSR